MAQSMVRTTLTAKLLQIVFLYTHTLWQYVVVSQLHSSIWEDPIRDLGINLVLRIAADVLLKRVWWWCC